MGILLLKFYTPIDFHNKCDKKGIIIVLIDNQNDINLEDILNYHRIKKVETKEIIQLLYFLLIIKKSILQGIIMIQLFVILVKAQGFISI